MLDTRTQKKILAMKKKYSIYSPWADKRLFHLIIEELAQPFEHMRVDKVLGLEARGFILGAPVAYLLHAGFVVARKKGKMHTVYSDQDVYSETFTDYSHTSKTLEIEKHEKGIQKGDKVVIVDDWFETGNQGHAAIRLVEKAGGSVVGISIMLDDMRNEVRNSFTNFQLNALVVKELFNET